MVSVTRKETSNRDSTTLQEADDTSHKLNIKSPRRIILNTTFKKPLNYSTVTTGLFYIDQLRLKFILNCYKLFLAKNEMDLDSLVKPISLNGITFSPEEGERKEMEKSMLG